MAIAKESDSAEMPESGVARRSEDPWHDFAPGAWQTNIDVRDFIQRNATPYRGDEAFLAGPTRRTRRIRQIVHGLLTRERRRGVLGVSQLPSSITAHAPGYIEQSLELIVGLQTDAPLKRPVFLNAGSSALEAALGRYGMELDAALELELRRARKTRRAAAEELYPPSVRVAREHAVVAGLPDVHARGQLTGDYRRVALYGVARLVREKQAELASLDAEPSSEAALRDREELGEQIRALHELIAMAKSYGYDITRPALDGREAVQWVYFAYLAVTKEQDGLVMPLGRVSTFLDVYFERDLRQSRLGEPEAQELIDDLVLKLRLVRFLRSLEHEEVCPAAGSWVTETVGGISEQGAPLVTKTSFRFLQTLENLGRATEPRLTILWSRDLPEGFRRFCARVSLETSALEYASDRAVRDYFDDDTAIARCGTAMRLGRDAQFCGGRVNLAKCLLYALNGGRDEQSGRQVMPAFAPASGDVLEIREVRTRLEHALDWLADTFVSSVNCAHYAHDKYAYERLGMALHDYGPSRSLAVGLEGLAVVADSLSAIAHARVEPLRDATGLIIDFRIQGDFPRYGCADDRADRFAREVVQGFQRKLQRHPIYRDCEHVEYAFTHAVSISAGKRTGNTPDGRRSGEPLATGVRESSVTGLDAALTAALSAAKVPCEAWRDGVSTRAELTESELGKNADERISRLVTTLDALFATGLFHLELQVRCATSKRR